MIRTIAVVLYFCFAVVFVLPFLILWSLIVGSPDTMYAIAMKVVRFAVRLAKVDVRVEGIENIPPGVCIFAANHISNIDPLAFVPAIPRRISLLVKKELFRIPIFSTAMRMAKFVPVDRADKEAATASVELAVRFLNEGLSFAVYPEGTRSSDGRLRPFKKGTFVMAIQAGVPVVPVSISGAQNLLRKGEWTIRPGEILVRFGPPVDGSQYTMEHRSELLARVEAQVIAGLPEDQRPISTRATPSNSP
jgi:1-acyl-sn-glycerol-3-phosphate acyltransferase